MAPITFPTSPNTVKVRMYNAHADMVAGARDFVEPVLKGQESFNFTSVAFVIDNETLNKRVLFDLGCRKDYWNCAPIQRQRLDRILVAIKVDKDAPQILGEAGIELDSIDSMIWSHMHWDHIGDASLFPWKCEVVVGKDFKKTWLPAYPTNPKARLLDAYFENRHINEISFTSGLRIGDFDAHDFFGDGSFYLLHAPGHCVGHMCGLARTTSNPDTFLFMGGDICHYPGMFRPTSQVPMPDPISPETRLDQPYFPSPCPCSMFESIHPTPHSKTEPFTKQPFYRVTHSDHSSYQDREQAIKDIRKLIDVDACPEVLVCIAHDRSLISSGVIPLMNDNPDAYVNDWQTSGWKEALRWYFLNELPRKNGERGRPEFQDAFYRGNEVYAPRNPAPLSN